MITREDLKKYIHLRREIEYLEKKIKNYKPAEIVADSVKGSSRSFPYIEHSIVIERIRTKRRQINRICEKT